MRSLHKFLLSTMLILLLSACGNSDKEASEDEFMPKYDVISRGYVLDQGFMTEAELDGIDFEALIECCGWDEGNKASLEEKPVEVRQLLLNMKENFYIPNYSFMDDYSWLVTVTGEESDEEFQKKDVSRIMFIKLICQDTNGNDECMIFDFAEGKAYFGENSATRELSLTEEQIKSVKKMMSACKVYSWSQRYHGMETNMLADRWLWWHLYYALEDGRIYSSSGYGGSIMPDNYDNLKDNLESFWQ